MVSRRPLSRYFWPISLAASVAVAPTSVFADPMPGDAIGSGTQVNQTISGSNTVNSGTYYNTPGGSTTFTSNTSLTLPTGGAVRGLEINTATVNSNGTFSNGSSVLTGNGGSVIFNAPIVKLNGTVDVSALQNSAGTYLGNGGNVTVNSTYYYQSGKIYANGANGGSVFLNVSSLTMTPDAAIYAKGFGQAGDNSGAGGVVLIGKDKNKGTIDIQGDGNKTAIIDTSGSSYTANQVIGTVDSNLIRIEGGLINLNGVLLANGMKTAANGNGNGGQIVLIANGNTKSLDQVLTAQQIADGGISPNEIASNKLLASTSDGNIILGNQARVLANGQNGTNASFPDNAPPILSTAGGNGGKITLTAKCGSIENKGEIQANGGKGGDGRRTCGKSNCGANTSPIIEPEAGGKGGTITLEFQKNLTSLGADSISAKGGDGGDPAQGNNPGNAGAGGKVILLGGNDPSKTSPGINKNSINVESGRGKNQVKGTVAFEQVSDPKASCPSCETPTPTPTPTPTGLHRHNAG